MQQDRLTWERGVLDGFEIALRLYDRQLGSAPANLEGARRAHVTFRKDAATVLEALRTHKLEGTAAFFGFNDLLPERVERLRALVPLPVEHDATTTEAGVPP